MSQLVIENKLIASVVLVLLMLALRWGISRFLEKRSGGDSEVLQSWRNSLNNVTQLLIVIGLIIIWVAELRYAALSVAAFIAAIVIATREFIQNFLGALYITSSRPFAIGDWVSIHGQVGEAVRSDWLTTTLLEVDFENKTYAYTGRTLVVPNNQFVTNTVQNLNFMRRYIAHTFDIVREPDEINPFEAKAMILAKAEEYCSGFNHVAERYNSKIEMKLGGDIAGPETSVRISSTNIGKNVIRVSIFCPTAEVVSIEQKITEDFMAWWYAEKKRLKLEAYKDVQLSPLAEQPKYTEQRNIRS